MKQLRVSAPKWGGTGYSSSFSFSVPNCFSPLEHGTAPTGIDASVSCSWHLTVTTAYPDPPGWSQMDNQVGKKAAQQNISTQPTCMANVNNGASRNQKQTRLTIIMQQLGMLNLRIDKPKQVQTSQILFLF